MSTDLKDPGIDSERDADKVSSKDTSEALADELRGIAQASDQEKSVTKDQIIKIGRDISDTLYKNSPKEADIIIDEIIKYPENDVELSIVQMLGATRNLIRLQDDISQENNYDKKKELKEQVLDITKQIRSFILDHRGKVGMNELTTWVTKATLAGQAEAVKYSPGIYNNRTKVVGGIIRGIAGEVAIGLLFQNRSGAQHQVEFGTSAQDLTGIDIVIHSLSNPNKTISVDVKTQPVVTETGASDNGDRVPVDQAICRRNTKTGRQQIWIHPDSIADNYQIHPSYEDNIYTNIVHRQEVLL